MAKGLALTIGLNSVDPALRGLGRGAQRLRGRRAGHGGHRPREEVTAQALLTKRATRSAVLGGIAQRGEGPSRRATSSCSPTPATAARCPTATTTRPTARTRRGASTTASSSTTRCTSRWAASRAASACSMFSDSCHSGTVDQGVFYSAARGGPRAAATGDGLRRRRRRYRAMPREVALRTYRAHRAMYDKLQKLGQGRMPKDDGAAHPCMLISGCQDNQLSQDGDFNGLFTANLLRVWNEGQFKGELPRVPLARSRSSMPPDQTPNFFTSGALDRNASRASALHGVDARTEERHGDLRRGSEGEAVRRWQRFLIGQGLLQGAADGVFGPVTERATRAFQRRAKVEADGVVGPMTYAAALQRGFDPGFTDPQGGEDGGDWPPRPDFPPLVANADRERSSAVRVTRRSGPTRTTSGSWAAGSRRTSRRCTVPQLDGVKGAPATGTHLGASAGRRRRCGRCSRHGPTRGSSTCC